MAQGLCAVRVGKAHDLQHAAVLIDGRDQGNHLAVQTGDQRFLLQILGNLSRQVERVLARLDVHRNSVDHQLHKYTLRFSNKESPSLYEGTSLLTRGSTQLTVTGRLTGAVSRPKRRAVGRW